MSEWIHPPHANRMRAHHVHCETPYSSSKHAWRSQARPNLRTVRLLGACTFRFERTIRPYQAPATHAVITAMVQEGQMSDLPVWNTVYTGATCRSSNEEQHHASV